LPDCDPLDRRVQGRAPSLDSLGLVTVGSLAGALAALWTVVALFLSITLIVLTALRTASAAATT